MMMTSSNIQVLALGAGVQSSALLLMSCKGLLPKIDIAIFSDVGWEPPDVYTHLEWLTNEAAKHDIPVVTVSNGNLRDDYLAGIQEGGPRFSSIPFFTKSKEGKGGMAPRHCTTDYKVKPLERYQRRELMGLKPRQHAPKEPVIDLWMGITSDEITRMRDSKNKWQVHVYPFLQHPFELLSKMWSRLDCINWLNEQYPTRYIPRSACIGCPFHDNSEWQRIKDDPELWKDAVEFDEQIRNPRGLKGEGYLHKSRRPLSEVDLKVEGSVPGQINLFENDCQGMCGL